MIQTLKNFTLGQVIMFKQIHVDPLIKLKKYSGAYTNVGPGIDKNGFPVTGLTEDVVDKSGKVTKIEEKPKNPKSNQRTGQGKRNNYNRFDRI